jgi:hypothetical protein
MKKREVYICPESDLRMCEEEMGRIRRKIWEYEIQLENATSDDERKKSLEKLENLEIHLQILQKRHAQLVFTKFGESVSPFGKIIWRN